MQNIILGVVGALLFGAALDGLGLGLWLKLSAILGVFLMASAVADRLDKP